MSTLKDELANVRAQTGKLTPQAVVDAARPPSSPLHNYFTWDDHEAAEMFRLVEARRLIRTVKVVYEPQKGGPRTIRAFHSLRDNGGREYVPVEEVISDPITRQLLVLEMKRDIAALEARYQHLVEYVDEMRAAAARAEAAQPVKRPARRTRKQVS